MTTSTFTLEQITTSDGSTEIKVGFGVPAQNPQILQDALRLIRQQHLKGGKLIKFNGPCSMPVAMALAHEVAHLYGAVACYDPKMAGYIICITHDPDFELGQFIGKSAQESPV